jgi:nitroimidazol reductase NimA-like FMN-containing flavoprotein (pyridoxamine 5'-phosphate oxidase superfamily)
MKELNSDFTNAKVGDKVWQLRESKVHEGVVMEIKNTVYRIVAVFGETKESFTVDGKLFRTDLAPQFFTHPVAIIHADGLENIGGFKERVMEVSNDGKNWKRRVVFAKARGIFIAWSWAERIDHVDESIKPFNFKYAREINHRAEEIQEQIAALQQGLETIENSK